MADKSLMTGAVNSLEDVRALFDCAGRTAVVTGGTGVLGAAMARALAAWNASVVLVSASRPLTRIAAYSASKAGISNFTQWLAVHLAQEYAPAIRVNAVMPGFFLTEQNRFLLTDRATGALTARGHAACWRTRPTSRDRRLRRSTGRPGRTAKRRAPFTCPRPARCFTV